MKTLFIGSQYDIINCNKALLVWSADASGNPTPLQFNDLNLYEVTYFAANRRLLLTRTNGILSGTVKINDFKFNYVIYYNEYGVPIGYTDLEQIIEAGSDSKYGINQISIQLDFTVFNQELHIDTTFNYDDHLMDTRLKQAHLNLFTSPDKAVTKSDIKSLKSKTLGYSKNLVEISQNPNLIYRYSGLMMKGNKVIKSESLSLSDLVTLLDLVTINEVDWLIGLGSGENLILRSMQSEIRLNLKYKNKNYQIKYLNDLIPLVGANLIVVTDGVRDYVCSMAELLVGQFTPLKIESTDLRWLYSKDPFTKNILFSYKLKNLTKVLYEDPLIVKVRRELNVPQQTNDNQLILVGEGFALMQSTKNHRTSYTLYNHSTLVEHPNGFELQSVNQLSYITALTPDAVLFRKSSSTTLTKDNVDLYLLEFFQGDSMIHSLGRKGSHRRLYKLIKTRRSDWSNLDISSVTNKGNCYINRNQNLELL